MRRALVRHFRVTKHMTTSEEQLKSDLLKEKTLYELLEVPAQASPQAIRSSYLRLARLFHPDLTGKPSEEFSLITRAYQTLSDPSQRVIYDDSLVSDRDYYTVGVGRWRIKLKYLFGASVSIVLAALAMKDSEELTEVSCPTSFKLRKSGASDVSAPLEVSQEDKEIRWAKAKPAPRPVSLSTGPKRSIFLPKDESTPTQSAEPVSPVKLPKSRSFSLDGHNTVKT